MKTETAEISQRNHQLVSRSRDENARTRPARAASEAASVQKNRTEQHGFDPIADARTNDRLRSTVPPPGRQSAAEAGNKNNDRSGHQVKRGADNRCSDRFQRVCPRDTGERDDETESAIGRNQQQTTREFERTKGAKAPRDPR